MLHAGPQLLIASLREKYWIPRIRNLVKTFIHQCLTYYRLKSQATQQFMRELPSTRVQPSGLFLNKGVDYAGPVCLRIESPSSKTIFKVYVAIFVCFANKAIHTEVVTSLTTEAFPAARDASQHVEEDQGPFILTVVPISKEQLMISTPSTRCSNPHRRWQLSRTSLQQKDASGVSSHHIIHTSEYYGRLQSNQ